MQIVSKIRAERLILRIKINAKEVLLLLLLYLINIYMEIVHYRRLLTVNAKKFK